MGRLIYSAISSLDGYLADEEGHFDWSAPDAEVHAFVNELSRPIGTYLFGRRMYEIMTFWETADELPDEPREIADFAALWLAADKVVYSTSLDAVSTARTTLERSFDPEAVRRWKAESDRDLSVGGPHLAAEAMAAGLVDEVQLFLSPVIVGGGLRALPANLRRRLELVDERRFEAGVVHLRYTVTGEPV
ncbi:dihydrofolate reductase family protein [Plantibacter sp. VKM Ac-2885]|uniref:Dihydrofolate reductase n=1 Tax=Plantibacter flavus TaxID=150123 RepID=A0A3N2C7X3_9MICO|nr:MULTISPECIES: dihydrofolate reductase family protein [Plantibacter]MBD8534180.1 dihydrofolate reductase family protein [Plantibacter sp. CFBP 13570]MBF4511112.1 dihydrofolate reductase family protein [Plantibacter sp. VKM Ac-2885]ROR83605.1 dihydrofolate reductase [Plantibacter flavus]SMG25231.1 Dihydrofolate reductase [Plantibacter flavus]